MFALLIATVVYDTVGQEMLAAGAATRLAAIVGAALWLSAVVAAMYAVLVVAISGSDWTQGSVGWARTWATQWLLIATCTPTFLAVAELAGDSKAMAMITGPMLILNVLGGWQIDLADPGFAWFIFTPLYHSASLLRFVWFGSLASRVPVYAGALCAWVAGGNLLFFLAGAVGARRRRRTIATAAGDSSLPKVAPAALGVEALHVVVVVQDSAELQSDAAAAGMTKPGSVESARPSASTE